MSIPIFTIWTCHTDIGPAHHIKFFIPTGHCEPDEFAQAAQAALQSFVVQPEYGIIFDGRGPIWGYGMLVAHSRTASWIGCREPRSGFVIVASQDASIAVGNRIPWGDSDQNGVVIAVCGPPHSGKSVFLAALYRALLIRRPAQFVFLQRACPDGEGMWFAESEPTVAQALRRKVRFEDSFVTAMLRDIDGLAHAFPLVLVDMPGRRDAIAEALLDHASHGLVLSRSAEESAAWSALLRSRGCEVLALFDSHQTASNIISSLDFTNLPFTGQLVGLERGGSLDPYREFVELLADWLVNNITQLKPRLATDRPTA